MHTVVLAGGFGTRLKSVLKDLPKPLAPVNDKCFLEYLLDNLKRNGLKDFIFCLHYMAEKITDVFDDGSKFGVKIIYSIEKEPMGTAGAIGLLRKELNETFCVVNADTYIELDIPSCIAAHKSSGAIATMAVTQVKDSSRYGRIILDNTGFIKDYTEKNESPLKGGYINAGLYIFEPKVFDYIPANRFVSLEKEVFASLLKEKGVIFSYPHVKNFFDIGIPEDYHNFQQWSGISAGRLA